MPITDGTKTLQVVTDLKKTYETKGKELAIAIEKGITLAIIDDEWKEHLREMDELKQSVQNATYEQKDPLLIYKLESYELFKQMLSKVNKEISSFLFKGNLPISSPNNVREAEEERTDMSKLKVGRSDVPLDNNQPRNQKVEPIRVEKKVGRNDPCPCGSGKKYKQCHGKNE